MAVQRRIQKAEELNLVPIMNLVTILIPFLIMAAQFVQLAVIDSTLPAIGAPTTSDEKPDKPPLNLSLAITDRGVTVMGADAILYPEGAPEVAEGEVPATDHPLQERWSVHQRGRLRLDQADRQAELGERRVPGRRGRQRHSRSRQPNQVRGNRIDDGREPG